MKTAVVFYSLEGNTRYCAEAVAKELGADLIELKPVKEYPTGAVSKFFFGGKSATFKETPELQKYDFDINAYDTVVIGTPLWAGKVTPPLRTFFSENDLSGKKVAVFICSGGGNSQKTVEDIKLQSKQTELIAAASFVNALKNKQTADGELKSFCEKIKAAE